MCKDAEARYERQLAERDSTIRKLITIGESKTSEGSVLRAELRRMYGKLDEERSSRQEADRIRDMALANLRAVQARELSQIRSGNPSESGIESGTGSKKSQDGEALATSPHTPSSKNPVMYSQKKGYMAEKVAECERVNGEFQPDPNDPGRCVFCHRRHGPTAGIGPPLGHGRCCIRD